MRYSKAASLYRSPKRYSHQGTTLNVAIINDAKTWNAISLATELTLSKALDLTQRLSAKMQNKDEELDFSKPWHLSDLTVVAEGKKFYVHKGILSMWSQVFEMKFMQKMKVDEITLTEKADEVNELLLTIYPSRKPVTEETVQFLLPIAHEYKMSLLVSLCERCLLGGTCMCMLS